MVVLRDGKIGRVDLTEINDKDSWHDLSGLNDVATANSVPYGESNSTVLHHGAIVESVVLQSRGGVLMLSLRPSRLAHAEEETRDDMVIDEEQDIDSTGSDDKVLPEVGDLVQAFVASTGKNGIFLRLSASCTGLVEKREMRDESRSR